MSDSTLTPHQPPIPAPPPDPSGLPRSLPTWAWIIAVLTFPTGPFIACGAARLLSWKRSILLAVISYASVIAFSVSLATIEHNHVSPHLQTLANEAGLLTLTFWGYLLYRIGRRADYWSPKARRDWRTLAWAALGFNALSLFAIALMFVLHYRYHIR